MLRTIDRSCGALGADRIDGTPLPARLRTQASFLTFVGKSHDHRRFYLWLTRGSNYEKGPEGFGLWLAALDSVAGCVHDAPHNLDADDSDG